MKTFAILGKDELAFEVLMYCEDELHWELVATVPVRDSWAVTFDEAESDPIVEDPMDVPPVDVVLSIGYDKILKPAFLDKHGVCLNLHNSPLPMYRGMRPINWALKNGEKQHGVTLHKITPGIDDGPVYGQITFSIWPEIDEVENVYARCARYGYELCTDVLPRLDQIVPWEQPEWFSYYSVADIEKLGDRKGWTREGSLL